MRVASFAFSCLFVALGCQTSTETTTPPAATAPQPPSAPSPPVPPESPTPPDGSGEPEASPAKLVGSGVPSGDPPANALRCTISDSNGPMEGGASTTSGCPENATCACRAQAGYSCGGACVRDGAWVLSGS